MATSRSVLQKTKKDIVRESKDEEREIKGASKDLARIEKAEHKAYRDVVKTEAKLEKAEFLADSNSVGGATLRQVQQAQIDFELSNQKYAQLHYAKEDLQANVEAAMQINDEHTKERNVKLNALHGPAAYTEASRFVPATESQATRMPATTTRRHL